MTRRVLSKQDNHDARKEYGYEWAPVADDDPRALVPPGRYSLYCIAAERIFYAVYRRAAVVLSLRIFAGPHEGTLLRRFYNVPADAKIRLGSHYWREWVIANQGVQPHRRERMAMRKFVNKLFTGEVVTVGVSWDGSALASAAYSKVARLIELLTTNEQIYAPPMPLPLPLPTPQPPPTPGLAPINSNQDEEIQRCNDSLNKLAGTAACRAAT
jgi:hypothetical protein